MIFLNWRSAEAGIAEAHTLMKQLGIEPSQLMEGSYVDLLTQGEERHPC